MSNLLFIDAKEKTGHIYKNLLKNYGIGKNTANYICKYFGVCKKFNVQELTAEQIEELERLIFKNKIYINRELKKKLSAGFEASLNTKSYKSIRKIKGYPANGQRTRSNAKTARKKRYL